ncbi:MAG: DUF1998 domain-containing protein [Armatimonadetes bacterium]|nr:DUF1998 domain-containing protein [Armatimonadota bacterium]
MTDHLHVTEEDTGETETWYLCRWCGTLHRNRTEQCGGEKCGRVGEMMPVSVFPDPKKRNQEGEGQDRQVICAACNSRDTITGTRSAEVADVHTLAESMLSAMEEETLRKLLVFSDNRQEAAFQAGWMRGRSQRHAMRHLLYTLLREESEPRTLDDLTDRLLEAMEAERVLHVGPSESERRDARTRVGWFVTQEFASRRERFGSLETLGLARVEYESLNADADPDFFGRWAERFGIEPDDVVAIVQLVLDNYRRRGALSHELLQHRWSNRDPEVHRGLISAGDWWRPAVITLGKVETHINARGLLADKGQTAAQHIVHKGVLRGFDHVDHFIEEMWDWLRDDARQYLIEVEITEKGRSGKPQRVQISTVACQVNERRTRVRLTDNRYVCNVCRSAQGALLATGACPEYRCDGTLAQADVDTEHYAVVRYTQEDFAPLRPVEHSGQVTQQQRENIEEQFKDVTGVFNCIVCTPTLELGVDIGQLEMILMRNVPPTPANYAQRAGRAGRRHRIAVVIDYCGTSPHDRYYFNHPEDMIDGRIRVPSFSMSNEPLIRKHVHSAILTLLRQLPETTSREALEKAFPRYIWKYFMESAEDGQPNNRYLEHAPTFPDLHALVEDNAAGILRELKAVFTETWPCAESQAVAPDILAKMITDMPSELERHVGVLFDQINGYLKRLQNYGGKWQNRRQPSTEEEREARRCQHALGVLTQEDQERYTLTYLSNDGYFPGYALTRDVCVARCLQPYIELQRAEPVALREFTPANWIYAAGNELAVTRVEFFSPGASSHDTSQEIQRREMFYDDQRDRVIDLATDDLVGRQGERFISFRLGGVELRQRRHIDDSRERRVSGAQDIVGTFLGTHHGGEAGELGEPDKLQWRLYHNADLRLVNLGPVSRKREQLPVGIPLCTICGAVRSPHAEKEIDRFEMRHAETCGKGAVIWATLHVDFSSDLIELGPLKEQWDAVNLMEAVLVGARQYLDMGEADLEGFVETRDDEQVWILIYDPMPGGSGFLYQLREHWSAVCNKAQEIVSGCNCEHACYACLLTFWNQRHHTKLDRHRAAELLQMYNGQMVTGHTIPPNPRRALEVQDGADSPAEERLLRLLEERNFPAPDNMHYSIQLNDGSSTTADFAYPDKRVLIYVDGMTWHGSVEARRSDRITRIKLRNENWKVIEMTAQDLNDSTAMNRVLEELAIYLERGDLL